MSYLLPYPSAYYIPRIYGDNADAGYTALTAKMDAHLLAVRAEVIELYYLKTSYRCPSGLLSELGDMLAAGLNVYETERQKRVKITYAVATHKNRGLWEEQVKPLFDSLASVDNPGNDARLINSASLKKILNIWVECDGVNNVGTAWSPEGLGDDPAYMGLAEVTPGGSYGIGIPGTIYVDCHYGVHTAVLTADTIARLVDWFTSDVIPAYMKGYLAYIDASGFVTVYSGGVVN